MAHRNQTEQKPLAVVIDDEFIIRELATSVLEDLDYDIRGFTTADDAIDFIHENHQAIEVVYTDIRMPGKIDGETLARKVAQTYPRLKVIMSSGHTRFAEQDPRDGTLFMAKPWSPADFKRLVTGLNQR